jgi:hypothetical protein
MRNDCNQMGQPREFQNTKRPFAETWGVPEMGRRRLNQTYLVADGGGGGD